MTYEIINHGSEWVLWKNIETDCGIGCHKIMTGTKAECQKRLEKLNGTGNRKIKSKKQRIGWKQPTTSRKNKATKKRDKKQR